MALNKKLHVAISTCDLDMAKEAIASGANTHSTNRCGLPALHAAISCPDNALKMVFLLLKAGVDEPSEGGGWAHCLAHCL